MRLYTLAQGDKEMRKFFGRDEFTMTFHFDDGTKLLNKIEIDIKDEDFFPKPALDDKKLKSEISGWLDALQQTIIGFMRQAPRRINRPQPKEVELGPNAVIENEVPLPETDNTAIPREIMPDTRDRSITRATCPTCGTQVVLKRECCGNQKERMFRGFCPQCRRPVVLPAELLGL